MISRRIIAALALLCALVAPAHAQKTKAQLNSEITVQFPDNSSALITPQNLRTVTGDIVNSLFSTSSFGVARMYPHALQTTSVSDCYTLIDPYGNVIPCTASTTSQGLQEFLNATTSNGWPADVPRYAVSVAHRAGIYQREHIRDRAGCAGLVVSQLWLQPEF